MAIREYKETGVAAVDRSGRPVIVYPEVEAGPAGPQGPAGPAGPLGPGGPQGSIGAVGAAGANGTDTFWQVISDTTTPLNTQLAGWAAGQQVWLEPGTYTLNAALVVPAGARLAGSRQAIVQLTNAAWNIQMTNDGAILEGFNLQTAVVGGQTLVVVIGDRCLVHRLLINSSNAAANRRTYGIYVNNSNHSEIFDNVIDQAVKVAAIYLDGAIGGVVRDNFIDLGDVDEGYGAPGKYGVLGGTQPGVLVQGNYIDLGNADYHAGVRPTDEWIISDNVIVTGGASEVWGLHISGAPAETIQFTHNYVRASHPIWVAGFGDDWVIDSNILFYGLGATTPHRCCIELTYGPHSDWIISNNRCYNALDYDLSIVPTNGTCQRFVIIGNSGSQGFLFDATTDAVNYLAIVGNVVNSVAIGMELVDVLYATISSNTIVSPTDGILVNNNGASGYHSIVSNVCYGGGANQGIQVDADDCTVSCNSCSNYTAGQGVQLNDDNNVAIGNVSQNVDDNGVGNDVAHNL